MDRNREPTYDSDMATRIETTVDKAASELARFGVPGERRVTVIVMDEAEEARLRDLRAAIAEGEASDLIDGEVAFAEIRESLAIRSSGKT